MNTGEYQFSPQLYIFTGTTIKLIVHSGRSSQVGNLMYMADKKKANLLYYATNRSMLVVRPVFRAYILDWQTHVTQKLVINHDVRHMIVKKLKIRFLTYMKSLFNLLIINASTTCLMTNVKAARKVYNEGIVDDFIWIRRKFNLSESMTKAAILP